MHSSHIAFLSTLLLTGCASTPEERTEKAVSEVPSNEIFSAETAPSLMVVDGLLNLFEDEQLGTLIEQALNNNPDLLAAAAQMSEAGFNFQKTKGGLFPTVGGKGSTNRSGSASSSTSENFSASLDVRWEVDIWSKLRGQTGAAAADLKSAEASYEASRQSLSAQTMQSWFKLIAAGQLLDLAEKERASFEDTRRLVERRYERGTATITEMALSRTDAGTARANYIAGKDNHNQAARELQILLGKYPNTKLQASRVWPKLDRSVPNGLPSELLLSRPDIIAAYEDIRAADFRARVAYADLFPSFALTASGGRSSETLSNLGRSAFDVWSLAGQVTAPIFEGGSRTAEVGAAEQRAERAYQNYRATVLNAFKEVEDALNSESYLAREESERLIALKAARLAEAKSLRHYEAGLIELIDLLTAQRRVFIIETRTINLRQARLNNRVSLALALGTGI